MKYLLLAIVAAVAVRPAWADLPRESVYQLKSTWQTQQGEQVPLSQLQGKVRLVAFVYTYCEHTCPTIVAQLKSAQSNLSPEAAAQTQVTLVSLDPERDTPEQLSSYMKEQKLEEAGWLMLHGSAKDVRTLAVLFGVRYQPMGESDIAHSNMITVLDTQGVIRYQMKGLSDDLQQVVAATEALVPHD
jgi:protein SCO1/2